MYIAKENPKISTLYNQLNNCSIFHSILAKSGTLECGVVQCWAHNRNVEKCITVHHWNEGEESRDAEQLIHCPIDEPKRRGFEITTISI